MGGQRKHSAVVRTTKGWVHGTWDPTSGCWNLSSAGETEPDVACTTPRVDALATDDELAVGVAQVGRAAADLPVHRPTW